jgi:hypothetical protein
MDGLDPQRICTALGLYLLVPKARGQFEELKFKTPSTAGHIIDYFRGNTAVVHTHIHPDPDPVALFFF